MRKITTCLILILITFSSFSQETYNKKFKSIGKYRFNFDLYGGIGKHTLYGDDISDNQSPLNLFYSLRARYRITKSIELEAGLGQSNFGTFINMNSPVDIEKTYNIPLLVRIPIAKFISIGAGVEYNLLNSAYQKSGDNHIDYTKDYEKSFWSPYIEARLSDGFTSLSLSYSKGVTPARTSPYEWTTGAFRIGLGFNIAKIVRMRFLRLYE